MKIRTGFVSNSSSSSFMAVIAEDALDKFKALLSPVEVALFEELSSGQCMVFGNKCVLYESMDGNHTFEDWVDRSVILAKAASIAAQRGLPVPATTASLNQASSNIQQEIVKLAEKREAFFHMTDF